MNNYKSNIIWQALTLITSGVLLFYISCESQRWVIFKEILIGIISAILLLLFIEIRNFIKDKKIYGFLNGEYKRLGIFNADLTATSNTKYFPMNSQYSHVHSHIKFNYKGNRKYEFNAEYFEGQIQAVVHLDEVNPTEGIGVYQYLSKKTSNNLPDIGYFKLQIDILNSKRLYLYHNNLIPNGLAEGYEIWEKV